MNIRQIIILIGAFIVSGLILWHDLPVEFPVTLHIFALFIKLSVVFAVAIFAFIFAAGKKKGT